MYERRGHLGHSVHRMSDIETCHMVWLSTILALLSNHKIFDVRCAMKAIFSVTWPVIRSHSNLHGAVSVWSAVRVTHPRGIVDANPSLSALRSSCKRFSFELRLALKHTIFVSTYPHTTQR